jgi:hypothetical protein
VPFRGLLDRSWGDVPYPEKLGLVRAVGTTDVEHAVRKVAEAAGIARVTEKLRGEVAELMDRLDGNEEKPPG